jgi:ubiquinone/menaquinone biosynthesis C-methylase UbiE
MTGSASDMRLKGSGDQPVRDELALLTERLPFEGARVLDLGCGAADKTRQLAQNTELAEVVAAEVDEVQHRKNLASTHSKKIRFASFGAQDIQAANDTFDIVLMFKSLHHVPNALLPAAMQEIARVLKPGGLAWFSEPVFDGAFNEVLRLFHDESQVREAAFETLRQTVDQGLMALVSEEFFDTALTLESFEQFDRNVIQVTHTDHNVGPALHEQIRRAFEACRSEHGYVFRVPNRVDVLRKPG